MRALARRPDEDDHRLVEEPDRDEALLAVVSPVVLDGQRGAREDFPARAMSSPGAARVAARFAASKAIVTVDVTTLNWFPEGGLRRSVSHDNYSDRGKYARRRPPTPPWSRRAAAVLPQVDDGLVKKG